MIRLLDAVALLVLATFGGLLVYVTLALLVVIGNAVLS